MQASKAVTRHPVGVVVPAMQSAKKAAEEFREGAVALFGPKHAVVASALNNLGVVYKVGQSVPCSLLSALLCSPLLSSALLCSPLLSSALLCSAASHSCC
jgi:hypothetical protein